VEWALGQERRPLARVLAVPPLELGDLPEDSLVPAGQLAVLGA